MNDLAATLLILTAYFRRPASSCSRPVSIRGCLKSLRKTSPVILVLPALFAAPLTQTSFAAESSDNKSEYTLFNRTPESRLRELITDRPDLTESPYTVDAGWFQIESDFLAYARDHDTRNGADAKTNSLSVAAFNFKVGLTSRIDLQTVVEPYLRTKSTDRLSGEHARVSGFGDVTNRLKINFWGNDGGESAFGIMPFVKWPTSGRGLNNDSVEGGIILPYAHQLPGGWDLGMMTEIDWVRNEADDAYTELWTNSVTLGHDLVYGFGGYVELASTVGPGPGQLMFDFGVTYAIGKHLQLDAGCNLGLTHSSDDVTLFSGCSVRF